MTPAEHHAEAERLTALAVDQFHDPEGGYDNAPPTAGEAAIRDSIRADASVAAAVYLAAAQVHATLAAAGHRGPVGCDACATGPIGDASRAEILAWLNAERRCFAAIMRAPWCSTVMETGGVTDEVELLDGSRLVLAGGIWVPKAGV